MRILLFLLISCTLLLTGCLNITEKLKLNKDGSGTYVMAVDMSELMSGGFLDMLGEGSEEDLGELGAFLSDSVQMDSISYFSEKPDSIKELWMYPDITKKAKEHILINGEKQQMIYTIELDFKNLSDIADFMHDLEASGGSEGLGGMGPTGGMSSSLYSWEGKLLRRSNNAEMQGFMEDAGVGEDEMAIVQMLFGTATHRTEITFPGKVKKTSLQDARVNGKTIVTEYPLMDLMNGEVDLNGTVKFKRK